ncbi:MAG: hypothetical protein JKX78_12180 [Alteromonadaceae bacterium]|nr:hypothetical protein [Alteromonadaceae bacterium]
MKLMQLTQYLSVEEAETIIIFLDDIKAMLHAHYGEEIRQNHRICLKTDAEQGGKDDF